MGVGTGGAPSHTRGSLSQGGGAGTFAGADVGAERTMAWMGSVLMPRGYRCPRGGG